MYSGASISGTVEDPDLAPGEGARWDVYCALPPAPRAILDVGCGAGAAFASYRERGTRLVGVDFDPVLLRAAAQSMDEVRALDLENDSLPVEWTAEFDVVACCDVLEHLRDPWGLLSRLRAVLAQDGVVVGSIPNVRQWRQLAKLVLGRWEYPEGAGTDQRDHIRFFTRRTIDRMFCEAGYQPVEYFWPRSSWHLRPSDRLLDRVTCGLVADFLYGSYTIRARPLD